MCNNGFDIFEQVPDPPKRGKVDVVVCTYNSERFLRPCLESIQENVPVHSLFVVDNYSQDRTVEIAKDYGAEIEYTKGSLAESRQLSFSLVETSTFVNIDSDIVLCKDWYNKVSPYLKTGYGAVWGVAINELQREIHDYQVAMYRWKNPSRYNLIVLGDMLCRKDAVQNLSFPASYRCGAVAGEDYYIKNFIEQKGYKTFTAPVYVEHYCNPPPLGLKTYWAGASTRLSYRWGLLKILRAIGLSLPQALYVASQSGNAKVIPFWLRFRFEELEGWLHWEKYYNLRRKPFAE